MKYRNQRRVILAATFSVKHLLNGRQSIQDFSEVAKDGRVNLHDLHHTLTCKLDIALSVTYDALHMLMALMRHW